MHHKLQSVPLQTHSSANVSIINQGLGDQGYELVSTGGSAAALEKASLSVQRVEQLTGFPEMLDGTLKSLAGLTLVVPFVCH